MREKRKRRVITLGQKQDVLKRLDAGEKVALQFGISKQQVSDIKKNKAHILAQVESLDSSEGLRRKSIKGSRDEVLDQRVIKWFREESSQGVSITGPMIQARARAISGELHPESGPSSFQASNGWLQRFRERHGIRSIGGRESATSPNESESDGGENVFNGPAAEPAGFAEGPQGFRLVLQVIIRPSPCVRPVSHVRVYVCLAGAGLWRGGHEHFNLQGGDSHSGP